MKKLAFISGGIALLVLITFVFGSTTHSELKGNESDKVVSFLDEKADEIGFNGTVLIAKDGEIISSKGYGFSDKSNNIKNDDDTLFHIASLSKSFTALSILQLEENGLLSLEDPLTKYVPNFPNGDSITIHHLLTHTSGIPDFLEYVDTTKHHDPEDVISIMKDVEPTALPGEKFSYGNTSYVLLGLIIEKVTGKSIGNYIEDNIIEVAQLTNTHVYKDANIVPAVGYINMEEPKEVIDYSLTYAAGSIISTVNDMYKFDQALRSGKLLSMEQQEKMYTQHIDNAPFGAAGYGYGWSVVDSFISFDEKVVAHSGGYTGYKNFFTRVLDKDITVIILSNNAGDWNPNLLTREVLSILLEKRFWFWQKLL